MRDICKMVQNNPIKHCSLIYPYYSSVSKHVCFTTQSFKNLRLSKIYPTLVSASLLLLSSNSSVFQVGSQTQIGPPPNYLENDFETTLSWRTGKFLQCNNSKPSNSENS